MAILIVGLSTFTSTSVVSVRPTLAVGLDALSFGSEATATFGANHIVSIDGRLNFQVSCSDGEDPVEDAFFAATDVYIVATPPADGDTLHDVGGEFPNTIVAPQTVFVDELIAVTAPQGALGDGTYSVVYDTCQDGEFNSRDDSVFADVITVSLPDVLPPPSAAVLELKLSADEERELWLLVSDLFDLVLDIESLAELATCDGTRECMKLVLARLKDDAMERLDIEGLPTIESYVTDRAKELLENQVKHYAAIALDPPDPNFRTTTDVVSPKPTLVGNDELIADALSEALVPIAAEGALAEALLHAIERYQGAQVAGDGEWGLVHARQIVDLSRVLAAHLGDTTVALQMVRQAVQSAPDDLDRGYAAAAEFVRRVAESGFIPDERRELFNHGLLAADVGDVELRVRRMAPLTAPTRALIVSAIDQLIAAHVNTVTALSSARSGFAAIATELHSQPDVDGVAPVADAGEQYSASVGVARALDGAASTTPAGTTINAYEWDLDSDGAFDDAVGASPLASFATAGRSLVGLRVTNTLGRSSVSYATINVSPAGQRPALSDPAPSAPDVVVYAGASQTFSVTATDPDGDTPRLTWHVDGVTSPSPGASFTFTTTRSAVGVHIIEVEAADSSGRAPARFRWEVSVLEGDVDVDGWTATSDCNDADSRINPAALERVGNALDDDCDPATPDAPSGGLTGTPWAWGSNIDGQIGNGAYSAGFVAPAPLSAFDDIVQLVGGFRTGYAVRADGELLSWGSNFNGELGDGTTNRRNTPGPVVGVDGLGAQLSGVTQLSTGGNGDSPGQFVAARRSDGTVVAWGSNDKGQLGDGSIVSFHSYPVRVLRAADGLPLSGVQAVEAGRSQGYALMGDGTVSTWGYTYCTGTGTGSYSGFAIPLPQAGSSVRQISAGTTGTFFLMADGSVHSCGVGQPYTIGRHIDSAHPRDLPFPVAGLGPGSGVIDISGGILGGLALKSDGSVWAWGENRSQIPTILPPGVDPSDLAPRQVILPAGPPVVDVDTRQACHTLALRADGSILVWGCDANGSTGLPTRGDVTTPTLLPLPAAAVAISPSVWNGMALTRPIADGTWDVPAPWVRASIADAEGTEAGAARFNVTLSEPISQDVTVSWSVEAGTADAADLALAHGATTIPAEARTAAVTVAVTDDTLYEDDESFTLNITGISKGIELTRIQATGVIRDDDDPPEVSVRPLQIQEGSTSLTDATVAVQLAAPSGKPVSVQVATADLTATAPDDYTNTTTTVMIEAGNVAGVAHIAVHGDRIAEPDETFSVRLSSPVGARLGAATAEVTIIDDEPLAIVVTHPSVTEGDVGTTTATFQVSLEPRAPAGTTVSVPYRISGATATIPADVTNSAGTLTFIAGDEPKSVTVEVVGDDIPEGTEFFRLAIGHPVATGTTRVILPPDSATAVIFDDDDLEPVDATPPGITPSTTPTTPDGTNGWFRHGVEVAWSVYDAESQVTSAACMPAAMRTDGVATFECTASSAGGTDTSSITVKNDSTEPVIACVVPAPSFTIGASGTVAATVTDQTSGPTIESVSMAATTSTAGTFTVRLVGVDRAGNSAVKDCPYTVRNATPTYVFTGFSAPVDNLPIVNTANAGQAIPLRWRVTTTNGTPVTGLRTVSLTVSTRACTLGSTTDQIEEYAAGSSDLQDQGNGYYQLVWKTPTSYAKSCKTLHLDVGDQTDHTAYFDFRK